VSLPKQAILAAASRISDEVIALRRHFHKHPELSFQEFETSEFIQKWLTEKGFEFKGDYVKTGIVAEVKGVHPSNTVFCVRGDMDALPIQEENTADYASQNTGVMHACGHDVHTSCIMGTMLVMDELKEQFSGIARFIFQPGEEVLPGGAKLMIEEGALGSPTPSGIVGQHVFPDLEAGKVGFRSGAYMASADELHITIKGKGGHAALPEKLIDPILISSHVIVALQQVVSRRNNPKLPSVLSIGRVEALGATNVIPDTVSLKGTFRTFDETWRFQAHEHIKKLINGMAKSMGGSAEVDIQIGYPSVFNDPELTERSKSIAIALFGSERVVDLEMRMTAEDFSWYTHHMPGCFYRLGTAFHNKPTSGLHTSTFDIDEQALEMGVALLSAIAINELPIQS
jgi:amidohydrolase